jgi:O-antigen/teichoic acid export membrane protein
MALSVLAEQIARPVLLILIAGALFITMQSPRAEHFVLACSAAYALAAFGQYRVVRRRAQSRIPAGESSRYQRVWLAASAGILLLNGAQVVRMNMDPMWVGLLLAPADVGIYTAALRVATLVSFILMIGGVVAQPTISALQARGARLELRNFITTTTRAIFLASLVVGVLLALVGPLVLSMLGAEFVAGYPALLALVAAHVLAASMGPLTAVLIMTGRQQLAAYVHVGCLPIQAVISVLLIRWQGVFGAALAAGGGAALSQIALYLIVRRTMPEIVLKEH